MQSANARSVTLICHPDSLGAGVRSITASTERKPDGVLAITYAIEGDLACVNVPLPRAPRIAKRLWQHTCCECFVALHGARGYHEFNFSPSSEWAAYVFSTYRKGAPIEDEALNPRIAVRRSDDRLEIDAAIPLGRVSAAHADARLALALSAVIEDGAGGLSYWALRHPVGRPDFHHRDAFVLELA